MSISPPKPQHHAVIAERARGMRRHMNVEEAALWRVLRRQGLGVRWVRQLVVGPFVADFAAPQARVIVEVDGGYHTRREAADARRDVKLRRWGWRLVRVNARDVMRHLPAVVREIEEVLGQ